LASPPIPLRVPASFRREKHALRVYSPALLDLCYLILLIPFHTMLSILILEPLTVEHVCTIFFKPNEFVTNIAIFWIVAGIYEFVVTSVLDL
jgi:uncharacterized membrane protein